MSKNGDDESLLSEGELETESAPQGDLTDPGTEPQPSVLQSSSSASIEIEETSAVPPSSARETQQSVLGQADDEPDDAESYYSPKGVLAWMAQNSVAANLLMLLFVVGGLLLMPRIKQEVFPEFSLDMVTITIAYPGASPTEVEQGVVLAVEEAVRDVDNVKEVRATASEGVALVTVELMTKANPNKALNDIKSAVDRITSFPQDIERPIVSLATNRMEVVSLVVYGDQSEQTLRKIGEDLRERLLAKDEISVVDLHGVRPLEVSIEVPKADLRRYGLTLERIAGVVRQASVDIPGGGIKTSGGEILVRTTERRRTAAEFGEIVVLSRPDGSEVKLRDIAQINDGFRDTDQETYYNGKRAVMVKVFRVGAQTPIEISDVVHEFAEQQRQRLKGTVEIATWGDRSEWYRDRLELLMRNAMLGLVLVMGILALFLEIRLAFWVTLGIPISFIGSLLFMPAMDASINMISLFAFIVTLGMVVDDAIVAGEAVYKRRTEGYPAHRAAIMGVREVAKPVIFAIATTILAFAPMLFVPGAMGKFFRLIPLVVISVLLLSLIESLLILPAHLAHQSGLGRFVVGVGRLLGFGALGQFIAHQQQRFSRLVEWLIERTYRPVLEWFTRNRYLALAGCVAILLSVFGLIRGGHVEFTFFPKVEGDFIVVQAQLPYGTPVESTRQVTQRILSTAHDLLEEKGGEEQLSRGLYAQVGAMGAFVGGDRAAGLGPSGSHLAEIALYLVPLRDRPFTASQFANEWRERVGDLPGIENIKFNSAVTGPRAGEPVNVELSHSDLGILESAAQQLARDLAAYRGVFDIDDGFRAGKEQLDFQLKPGARALGVTEAGLARQVRSSFFGAEAVREQRGRDELRVYVRLPKAERQSEYDLENLLIQTPRGGEVPLGQAADVKRGRSYTSIQRREGRRIVNVTADLDPGTTNAGKVLENLQSEALPRLMKQYPNLKYSFEGEQNAQRETLGSLFTGFKLALIAIFALLAVAFRSYLLQPLIIVSVIPFGLIGAVMGHVILGYDLSLMSMMGIVALSGVVVNDSLILIVAINRYRELGMSGFAAISAGGTRRFRPIILTSLTTFFGLMPMILETSAQARFLIPMAISLGFGVLFATVICLLIVPAAYAIMLDFERFLSAIWRAAFGKSERVAAE